MDLFLLFDWLVMVLLSLAARGGLGKQADFIGLGRHNSNTELTVTTVLIEPYVMRLNHTGGDTSGESQQFEGFLVDFLDHLASDVGFQYKLVPERDGRFGVKRPDFGWDGMIGELMRQEADIAAGPMYQTDQRKEYVSFTQPFLSVQASLIMRQPSRGGPIGINSLEDLYYRNHFTFGTLDRGIVKKSFKQSNNTMYKTLLTRMNNFQPKAYTKTNAEGLERIRSDDTGFIYILPSTIADYIVGRKPCDLRVVDKFLMHESFSLALQKRSHLLPYLNEAIGSLEASGILKQLYHKWWFSKADCDVGPSVKTLRNADSVEMYDMHSGSKNSADGRVILKDRLFQLCNVLLYVIVGCLVR